MNINTNFKKYLYFVIGCFTLALGINMATIANLGVAVYDAFIINMSSIINTTYGVMSFIIGIALIGFQIILRRKLDISYLFQLLTLSVFSVIIDFLMYSVFSNLNVETISIQFIYFIFANIFICLGIALILSSKVASFPLETSMSVVYDKFKLSMSKIKYGFDAFWLLGSIVLAFIFKLTNINLGLGTVVMFLLHGSLINYFFEKINQKLS